MRNYIDIVESHLVESKTLQVDGGNNPMPVTVWMNPTHEEVYALSKQFDLRGLVSEKYLILWDAHRMIHWQMEDALKREHGFDSAQWSSLVICEPDTDMSTFNYEDNDDGVNDWPDIGEEELGDRSNRGTIEPGFKLVVLSAEHAAWNYAPLKRILKTRQKLAA